MLARTPQSQHSTSGVPTPETPEEVCYHMSLVGTLLAGSWFTASDPSLSPEWRPRMSNQARTPTRRCFGFAQHDITPAR